MKDTVNPLRFQSVLAAAIGAVLLIGTIAPADAQYQRQSNTRDKREAARQDKQSSTAPAEAAKYPNATRQEPDAKASTQQSKKLQKLVDLYEEDKAAEARALADEIIAAEKGNAYDKSFAAQLAAQAAYDADDAASAMTYLEKALEFNGLDNNGHFAAMLMLAQLQMQEEQYEKSLATFDRLFEATGEQNPEHLALKGNSLYRLERYPEAIAVLKQAIAASPEPKAEWTQLLMAAHFDSGQTTEAAALAEQIASKNPSDKRAQMNLVASYLQVGDHAKAVKVLEALRGTGQLTEANEYRQLYAAYLNLDKKEAEAADVISEGLLKGILAPDHDTLQVMGQAYYFSEQVGPAVAAYQKAAPLAKDGETYLNLAKILWQEDRITEAKVAARQAIAKGLKNPKEAEQIIALPGG
ncbi:MAG: tetratricopeptide repeat protein [Lysobacter sp.]|nr:tetratricopeptide repeat protein [Lysobacter sp.]MDQ3270037.1 tetratricopeptide repeat protein [Pseudomonadota bacterium]